MKYFLENAEDAIRESPLAEGRELKYFVGVAVVQLMLVAPRGGA